VDDYIVKPADVANLVGVIEQHLTGPRHSPPLPPKRMYTILKEQQERLLAEWLASLKSDPELCSLSDFSGLEAECAGHVPAMLNALIDSLERHPETLSAETVAAALHHGRLRRRQGFTLLQVLREARHLRRVLEVTVQKHLLSVDISTVIPDLIQAAGCLDLVVENSVEGYLDDTRAA
jgi:hypothetical protein